MDIRKLLITGIAVAASINADAALPKDPCALLKQAEIQALAPGAKLGNGVPDVSMGALGVACAYSWGPRTSQWGESSVTVTIIDTSQAYPGRPADAIRDGMLAKARKDGANASEIRGVGDVALFSYEARSYNGTAETYIKAKNAHLQVRFHSGEALANKDKIVALLKSAAARL